MIRLILITNSVKQARLAIRCGVERIFVDLERLGKKERQGNKDTFISTHTMEDISKIRMAIPNSELLVRLNPVYEQSMQEIDEAIERGADFLMFPMFKHAEDLNFVCAYVNHRVGIIPLLETPEAMHSLEDWVDIPGISEIYIGLNDLHLALEMDFMFQLLADGSVEKMASIIQKRGIPFGFGGIARADEGLLSGESVLAEHLRLKSSAVILSRTFHRNSSLMEEHESIFADEILKLRISEKNLEQRTLLEQEQDRQNVVETVNSILQAKK